jgi:hypothetical protein
MIDANLLFILSIILVILAGESTLKRAAAREAFRESFNGDGCNVTNGCLPCGYPCRKGCPRNIVEGFDINNRRPTDYLQNYEIQIKENCAPDEVDMGDTCVKNGCPAGFEQGEGPSETICYPKCLPNYDSNGSYSFFQICPPGYETRGTQCYRPPHWFRKHTVQMAPQSQIAARSPIPLINTPIQYFYGGYGGTGYYPPTDMITMDNTDSWYLPVRMHGDSWTNYIDDVEYFVGGETQNNTPAPDTTPSTIANTSAAPLPENKPMTNPLTTTLTHVTASKPTVMPSTPMKINKDQFIPANGSYCPYGYALSGSICYENCPPNYKDIDGVSCMREGYLIDRPNYDRGSGVPFSQMRSKYARIHPGN